MQANASLNAERQFAQRMMESVRTLKQQVADLEASGKQQQEQDRRRIRQLEVRLGGAWGPLFTAPSANCSQHVVLCAWLRV